MTPPLGFPRNVYYLEAGLVLSVIFLIIIGVISDPVLTGAGVVISGTSVINPVKDVITSLREEIIALNNSLFSERSACASTTSLLNSSLKKCQRGYASLLSNYTSLLFEKNNLTRELSVLNDSLVECQDYVFILESSLESNVSALQEELRYVNDSLAKALSDYEELVINSASKICCIQRIVNPRINYYIVKDNSIECLTAQEDGSFKLEC